MDGPSFGAPASLLGDGRPRTFEGGGKFWAKYAATRAGSAKGVTTMQMRPGKVDARKQQQASGVFLQTPPSDSEDFPMQPEEEGARPRGPRVPELIDTRAYAFHLFARGRERWDGGRGEGWEMIHRKKTYGIDGSVHSDKRAHISSRLTRRRKKPGKRFAREFP